ncbi:MAG: squalene/phytoene synthase family protein, partial [Rhodospirillaceae bacterium]
MAQGHSHNTARTAADPLAGDLPSLSAMANLVRRHDPNRFQTALFAKADIREALFALYAFNVEMSRMGENLSEPLIGQMRLQWWVDLIEQMGAGTPPERGHPIGDRIGQVMGQGVIALLPLVEARQADLDESPFPELAAMELYADQTAGALAEQAALLLGADPITDQTELTR